MSKTFEELNNALLRAIERKEMLIKNIEKTSPEEFVRKLEGVYGMPKLSDEQLKTIPLKELQEIVYELGIDEAYEIEDRDTLIDYYIDWS